MRGVWADMSGGDEAQSGNGAWANFQVKGSRGMEMRPEANVSRGMER